MVKDKIKAIRETKIPADKAKETMVRVTITDLGATHKIAGWEEEGIVVGVMGAGVGMRGMIITIIGAAQMEGTKMVVEDLRRQRRSRGRRGHCYV
jgi:hypothetical protein